MSLSYELWKLKTAKSCFQFPQLITQKSENWVMETELSFAKQPFCYESHHFWIMNYENRELSYQKTQSKRPLILFVNNLLMWPFQDLSNTYWSWRHQRSKKIGYGWDPKVHPCESSFQWEARTARYYILLATCLYACQLKEPAAKWSWWRWSSCST